MQLGHDGLSRSRCIVRRRGNADRAPRLTRADVITAYVSIPSYVTYRSFPEKMIVLDALTGTYHELNPCAGRLLTAVDGASPCDAAASLADELRQPADRILDDLAELVIQLSQSRLVCLADEPPAHPVQRAMLASSADETLLHESIPALDPLSRARRARGVVYVLWAYLLTRLHLNDSRPWLLAPSGAARTVVEPLPECVATAQAVQLGITVTNTLSRLPFRSTCLVRALVLLRLLSKRGISGRLVIGVDGEAAAFAAHAWVEHRGIPLLPDGGAEYVRIFG